VNFILHVILPKQNKLKKEKIDTAIPKWIADVWYQIYDKD
jgi:hypothetical protein